MNSIAKIIDNMGVDFFVYIQKDGTKYETFEKCSILFKIKEDENFNHRNILNISRIEIRV